MNVETEETEEFEVLQFQSGNGTTYTVSVAKSANDQRRYLVTLPRFLGQVTYAMIPQVARYSASFCAGEM